jgi:TonB dependent receptor
MASKIINTGLKRTALSVALGMCFAGSVLAQSNSTGSIAGTTDAGATVTIENPANGFKREITAGADGQYRLGSLPTGNYKVTTKGQTRNVAVTIGGTATGSTTDIAAVNVTGTGQINAIDVSSVESTTILTAEQIAKIPVPRNVTAVALLAPGTVRGDSAYGNLASFGGSSVAENQFYVNGFNITNAFKNLSFGTVPFEAIAEQQVKTGGYGAEFGRSTGGVVNLVTKRGTNEFHAGGNIFVTPESLRSPTPDVYTNGGYTAVYNQVRPSFLYSNNSKDRIGTNTTSTLWASGALIQDRLFAYALVQYTKVTGSENYGPAFGINTRGSVTSNSSSDSKSPNWLVKLDWNISDSHLLELTAFSDSTKSDTQVYSNPNPAIPVSAVAPVVLAGTFDANRALQRGAYRGEINNETGGDSYALKYTGYLTDNFTLSALYGQGKTKRSQSGRSANGTIATYNGNIATGANGCPAVSDGRTLAGPAIPATCNFIGAIGSPNNKDKRDQFRVDAEWQLGDHLLRFGYDSDKFKTFDSTDQEGGVAWTILDGNVAEGVFFRNGADVEVDSTAYYLEDTWNITDNFLAYGGLRWDTFKNKNGDGATFVEIKNQFAPRLGFSWDVNGDSKFKVFGNAGRYALPLTATVAIRGASASLFADNLYTYSGFDQNTGAPLNTVLTSQTFLNGENGKPKDPRGIADTGLKPQYQDEYILGVQMQLTDHLSGGVRGVFRDLKTAIDDFCDFRYFNQWAVDNGKTWDPSKFSYCHLYNPGRDSVFFADVNADGVLEAVPVPARYYATLRSDPNNPNSGLAFTPEQIALIDKGSKAKRTYKAVEFFLEGHWDKFFMQGSYTWSQSKGNFEGGVKSDIGQADTGTTQDFDYPELEIGTTGFLPNDRRHSFKLFGNYEISDEWSAGFNLLVQAGRPLNCLGLYDSDPVGYRNSYFSCDSGVGSPAPGARFNNGKTFGNRGDRGTTAWTRNLDLNVAYKPTWADGKMTVKMDVFNVFNETTPASLWERGEDRRGRSANDTYLIPTSFQASRSFRFMVQYDY